MNNKRLILIIEDDRIDTTTLKRAFKANHITHRLLFAADGEDALEYLNGPGNEKPGIILLDLNLPKMNGLEFLRIVKQDVSLRKIPVVILTTSHEEQDKINSFDLGASGYILKSVGFTKLVKIVKIINQYWALCELPEEE